jgi:hypothetical protein
VNTQSELERNVRTIRQLDILSPRTAEGESLTELAVTGRAFGHLRQQGLMRKYAAGAYRL